MAVGSTLAISSQHSCSRSNPFPLDESEGTITFMVREPHHERDCLVVNLTWIPQSKSKMPQARWNPGAAKASDSECFKVILPLWHIGAKRLKPRLKHRRSIAAQRQKPVDVAA
jgi:hypothetical protein